MKCIIEQITGRHHLDFQEKEYSINIVTLTLILILDQCDIVLIIHISAKIYSIN